ncbi:hypothetical protein PpBr36_02171 [Pyricularia pennisetigena]|uniref:hypothetical protein n=1 Tax=Pyricularia pennisetigena TaxID=1578925 RepID=UPI00114EA14B|nr:hypothetical protein PpBr36_02171 [Pyricularia pennisetigena]TLS29261.1 hypothetical protein PpBr36_02171 [Pyricularia pennisetigena]
MQFSKITFVFGLLATAASALPITEQSGTAPLAPRQFDILPKQPYPAATTGTEYPPVLVASPASPVTNPKNYKK